MHSILNILASSDTPNYDLTTLDDVISALSLDDLDSSDTDEIEAQITFQSRVVASLTGRVFASRDVLETFWTDDTPLILPLPLKQFPVTQVDLVAIEGISTDDYTLDSERGLLWLNRFINPINTRTFPMKVAVTYTGGYDLPDDAPAALSAAVIELIREQRRRAALTSSSGSEVGQVRATQHGDTRVEYATTSLSSSSSSSSAGGPVPLSVLNLIDPFKAPAV
jgi:hypothetical protein